MIGIGLALAVVPGLRAQVQVSVGLLAHALVECVGFVVGVPELAALSAQGGVSALTRVKSWCSAAINEFGGGLRFGLRFGLRLWLRLRFGCGLRLRTIPDGIISLPDNIVDLDGCFRARVGAVFVLSAGDIVGLSSVIHTDSHSEVVFQSIGDTRKILAVELKLDLCVALSKSCADELNIGTFCRSVESRLDVVRVARVDRV